jgi:RNA polymerase sigma-70 factor, ECF subfamily
MKARDPRALGAFFDRHMPRIYGLAYRLLGDVHAAEDLTQEVLFRTYRALDRLDPTRDPVPWLVAITYNVFKDHCRSAARQLGLRSQSIDGTPALAASLRAPEPDPERRALQAEEELAVQEALLKLPEHERAVVLLHDFMGQDHETIARLMKLTHAAARKRYSRALAALARHLKSMAR